MRKSDDPALALLIRKEIFEMLILDQVNLDQDYCDKQIKSSTTGKAPW